MVSPRGLAMEIGGRMLDTGEVKNAESRIRKKFKTEKFPISWWEFAMVLGDLCISLGVFSNMVLSPICSWWVIYRTFDQFGVFGICYLLITVMVGFNLF